MSTNIIQALQNFESTLQSKTAKQTYAKVVAHYQNNPINLTSGYHPYNTVTVGNGNYVSFGSLIDALNERDYEQNPTISTRILTILTDPKTGLIYTSELYQPIRVGYKFLNKDGIPVDGFDSFEVVGGNHRGSALILGMLLSGHDLECDDVRNLFLKVETCIYSERVISTDNGSRALSTFEKKLIESSIDNIDFDTQSFCSAFFNGAKKPKDAFELAFVAEICNSELLTELTTANGGVVQRLTIAQIAGHFYTDFKNNKSFALPKNVADMVAFIELVTSLLPKAIKTTKATYSNIARNARVVATNLRLAYIGYLKANKATPVKESVKGVEQVKTPLTPANTAALSIDAPVKITKLGDISSNDIKISPWRKDATKMTTVK